MRNLGPPLKFVLAAFASERSVEIESANKADGEGKLAPKIELLHDEILILKAQFINQLSAAGIELLPPLLAEFGVPVEKRVGALARELKIGGFGLDLVS